MLQSLRQAGLVPEMLPADPVALAALRQRVAPYLARIVRRALRSSHNSTDHCAVSVQGDELVRHVRRLAEAHPRAGTTPRSEVVEQLCDELWTKAVISARCETGRRTTIHAQGVLPIRRPERENWIARTETVAYAARRHFAAVD